jgi:hypothetical protein
MAPHSKLLLSEMIIKDHNPSVDRCIADITMMVTGGAERSTTQWTNLLQSEGFRILGFYGSGNAVNGIIEAEMNDA